MSDSVFLVRAQTSSFFQHAMLRIIKFNFFNAESEESLSILKFFSAGAAVLQVIETNRLNFEKRFLYIMKNLPTFAEKLQLWEEDPYFQTMLEEAEYARMNGQEKKQYREMIRQDWDYQNTMDYAIAEGHAQGKEEGIAEGRVEGQAEEKQAVARRMLAKGMSVGTIMELTELTEEQVREIAATD